MSDICKGWYRGLGAKGMLPCELEDGHAGDCRPPIAVRPEHFGAKGDGVDTKAFEAALEAAAVLSTSEEPT